MQRIKKLGIAIFLVLTITVVPLFGQPQFSGFQNGGKTQGVKWKLPTEWSPDQNVKWEFQIEGYGQSSPVVAGDTVYVTSVSGDNKEEIVIDSVNIKTGKKNWSYRQPNSAPEKNTVMVSRAAPTPIVDQDGVIAFFEGGNLVALDAAGKVRWKRDLVSEYGKMSARHGLASSLEQDTNSVFVWCERMEKPFVLAISKKDGKNLWKVEGVGGTTWGSPRLIEVGSETHLVLAAMGKIVGLNPESGARLWEFTDIAGNSSSTPMTASNGEFVIGASAGRGPQASAPSCGVVTVNKHADGYEVAWKWRSQKATCSFGSPVVANGKAYFVNQTGIVYCHDMESGKLVFNDRLPAGSIWATPLATQNHVYFFGKDGKTTIVEAGDTLKVIQENKLWNEEKPKTDAPQSPGARLSGSVLYAAAVSQETLLLRRGDRLYAIAAKE